MEIYKRKVGYESFGKTNDLVITATTLYFPIFLTQNFEDIGVYTDTENPVYEILDFSSVWNLSNTGSGQKPCGILNNCTVNITETGTISYFGGSDGALSVNISNCTPSTYEWTGPNNFVSTTQNISNLKSGNYTLKITDSNCDITYASYYLQQPRGLGVNVTSSNSQINDINGTCNGSATVVVQGGVPPYTYLWYSGTTSNVLGTTDTITNLCSGTYTVQVTDSTPPPVGPVIISGVFNITEPNALSGSVVTKIDVICYGGNNGSITIQGYGGNAPTGYTYTLNGVVKNTATNVVYSGLTAGNYTVQIKDDSGSIYNLNLTLTNPPQITTTYNISHATCYGETGSVSTSTNGGTPPYTITLKNTSDNDVYDVDENGTANELIPGPYLLEVLDSNGCTNQYNLNVLQRPRLGISYTTPALTNGYNIPCFGNSVSVNLTTSYLSDSYITNPSANQLKYYLNDTLVSTSYISYSIPSNITLALYAGDNIIKVEDGNGCTTTKTIKITQPAMPLSITYGLVKVEDSACGTVSAPAGGGNVTCHCVGGCGKCRQAVIDINGGVAPYTIVWSDSGTNNQLTSAAHCVGYGTVTATVTDANGCIQTVSISI